MRYLIGHWDWLTNSVCNAYNVWYGLLYWRVLMALHVNRLDYLIFSFKFLYHVMFHHIKYIVHWCKGNQKKRIPEFQCIFYLNYLLVVLKNGKAGFQNLNSSLASCEQLFMALVTYIEAHLQCNHQQILIIILSLFELVIGTFGACTWICTFLSRKPFTRIDRLVQDKFCVSRVYGIRVFSRWSRKVIFDCNWDFD